MPNPPLSSHSSPVLDGMVADAARVIAQHIPMQNVGQAKSIARAALVAASLDAMAAPDDAKTLYGALSDLLAAIDDVDREGEAVAIEELDAAMMEAQVVLGALKAGSVVGAAPAWNGAASTRASAVIATVRGASTATPLGSLPSTQAGR